MLREPPNSRFSQLLDLEPLHRRLAEGFDPNFSRPVDADFDDVRAAYLLVARVGRFDLRQTKHAVVLGLGACSWHLCWHGHSQSFTGATSDCGREGETRRQRSWQISLSPRLPLSFSAVAARSPPGYNPATMDGSRRTTGLVLLGLLALGLRVWVVFALSTEHTRPLDYEHGRIAENLLTGKGFSVEFLGQQGPTSQQSTSIPCCWPHSIKAWGCTPRRQSWALSCSSAWPAPRRAHGRLARLVAIAGTADHWLDRRADGGRASQPSLHGHPSSSGGVGRLGRDAIAGHRGFPRWQATWQGAALAGGVAGVLLLVEPILSLSLPIAAAMFWLGAQPRREDGGWVEQRAPPIGHAQKEMLGLAASTHPTIRNTEASPGQPAKLP